VPAALAFAVLTLAVSTGFRPVIATDAAVSAAVAHLVVQHPYWVAALRLVTHTADTQVLTPVAIAGLTLLAWMRRWTALRFALVAAAATTLIRLTVLAAVARPRPPGHLAPAHGWAYPSGHTTFSATLALTVVMLAWQLLTRRWQRTTLAVGVGIWAALIGVSRVALIVHWPTDVLAAWLMVTAAVLTTALLLPLHPRLAELSEHGHRTLAAANNPNGIGTLAEPAASGVPANRPSPALHGPVPGESSRGHPARSTRRAHRILRAAP
jgi:undecaprenyl-diphosphatase